MNKIKFVLTIFLYLMASVSWASVDNYQLVIEAIPENSSEIKAVRFLKKETSIEKIVSIYQEAQAASVSKFEKGRMVRAADPYVFDDYILEVELTNGELIHQHFNQEDSKFKIVGGFYPREGIIFEHLGLMGIEPSTKDQFINIAIDNSFYTGFLMTANYTLPNGVKLDYPVRPNKNNKLYAAVKSKVRAIPLTRIYERMKKNAGSKKCSKAVDN